MVNVTPNGGNPMGYDLAAYMGLLSDEHRLLLASSAVKPEVANARGYMEVTTRAQLSRSGHGADWITPPGVLIQMWNVRGVVAGNQYRPDVAAINLKGKALKYITPRGMANFLDVNPLVQQHLNDPTRPLYITEGTRKADAIVSHGGVGIALLGVFGWRGTNSKGGKTVLADFEAIAFNDRAVYLVFDSDVVTKPEVGKALARLWAVAVNRGADVRVVKLPQDGDAKVGVDDYLAAGHSLADLDDLVVKLSDLVEPPSMVTEAGVADDLVSEYGDRFRFCPERGRWLTWDESRWRWDIPETVRECAKKVALAVPWNDKESRSFHKRMNSAAGISGITRLAQTDPQIVALIGDLDADPYALNTPSGVLNLRTGAVREHTDDDLFTKITGCAVSQEDCPKFRAFLAETFGGDDDLIAYVQRLLGYSATGVVLDHVLPFCFGSGANGKSVLMGIVMAVLGRDEDGYALAAPSDFLMQRMGTPHPTEVARLRGARFVTCQEVNADQRFDEAKIKQLTGGDDLAGRFMHRDFFTFHPSHHLWLAGNHKPEVRDGGPAFWRRVRLIPFEHVVPDDKQNPNLAEELFTQEGPQILGWLAAGAADMLRDGLREPEAVTSATRAYRNEEEDTTVPGFLAEECVKVDASPDLVKTPVSMLRAKYSAWCQRHGEEPVGVKTFTQRLETELCRRVEHGRTGSVAKGVRLKTEAEADRNKPPDPPPCP